ncbi:hypothetical protein [Candidatus Cardinium hertigii]|uniref:Uncharacterized protein n=1 Tax=Candidatus Cardinium hertigii TaxID=247481 RepID=A0A3N2QAX6_9BACT|nr:hypothetical protein [Candidatus Cardinium hertigii]ROT46958.1 hypothetical protein EDM02_05270 [Candidatus Cardinium hertigii]
MSTSTQKLILLMLVQRTTAQQCSGGHNPSSNPKAITAIPDKIDEKSEENAKHLEHVPVAHSTESKPVEPSAPPAPSPSIEIEESKAQLDEPIKQKPKTKAYTKEEEDDENEEEDEKEGKGKKKNKKK